MSGQLDSLGQSLQIRPWWLNGVWFFCLYMTFVYMPWDIFWKPIERWEEVWFGFTLTGWPAKLTEPIHWAIYAAGSYGLWKMKPWLWPWASIYCAQIAVAMLIFNYLEGPAAGDGRGGGPIVAIAIFIAFSYLTWLLWKAKPLFGQPPQSEQPPG